MKKNLFYTFGLLVTLVLFSCSNDDDGDSSGNQLDDVNVTTLVLTLTPEGGGTPVIFTSQDLDGTGPGEAELTVEGTLTANTSYTATIVFLNDAVDPQENQTITILQNPNQFQVFYISSDALNLNPIYLDGDGNGNPLGILMGFEAGDGSFGNLTISLRQDPNKPNDGSLSGAGGTTRIETTFTGVAIQ
ncbi:type 1 periplasmic binding fold superfamily protein [Gilvibacter sp.]|uniref:type 1 periplasmic binding fold superfamily protein n=1 Tax=Gilvibacter sp. TaxID=2729997 RepID=UPI003F4A633A